MKDQKGTEFVKEKERKAAQTKSEVEARIGREQRLNGGRETISFMAPAHTFRPTP